MTHAFSEFCVVLSRCCAPEDYARARQFSSRTRVGIDPKHQPFAGQSIERGSKGGEAVDARVADAPDLVEAVGREIKLEQLIDAARTSRRR